MLIKARSSKGTKRFYGQLMQGKVRRGLLGTEKRFNANAIIGKESVQRYFTEVVAPHISTKDCVLDLGCGTGGFALALAPLCKEVVAIDIVEDFVEATTSLVIKHQLTNVSVIYQDSEQIPAEDQGFDVVLLVDVIHHLENIDQVLKEVIRVLRPGGRLLIFEPNKLNPLMFLMHLVDRNEWGLLRLGRPRIYKKRLADYFEVDSIYFSGLVIGPDSGIFLKIANFLNKPMIYPLFGWLLPKIFIVGRKNG